MNKYPLAALLLGLSIGCASDPKPPPAAPAAEATQPEAEPQAEAAAAPEKFPNKDPKKAKIHISDRIKQACGLSDTETYFDYDRADVSGQAKTVLKKLADCFTTGPLAGEPMKLVGHADPRGDEEYNMVLGERRAEAVKVALVGFKMKDEQISCTSRGEMEAVGTDEESWAKDRKVEVKIDD